MKAEERRRLMWEPTWTDHLGVTRKVSKKKGRLKFTYNEGHRALRAFVFQRDFFTCQWCGLRGINIPANYDGSVAVSVEDPSVNSLVMDHIVSIRNGGTHHPANLVTLCDSCNAMKVGLVDVRLRDELRDEATATAHGEP